MINVRLYGHLGKKFGRVHRLDVRNPREAIRALSANFPEFKSHVIKHSEPGYHIRVGKDYRDADELSYPADGEIKIIPVVAGSSGLAKIVVGVTLMVVGTIWPNPWLFKIGASLALSGVAQILFAPPAAQKTDRPDNKPSFTFSGPVNSTAQGNPVPVCYGRMIVGSQVVSAGLETSNISL